MTNAIRIPTMVCSQMCRSFVDACPVPRFARTCSRALAGQRRALLSLTIYFKPRQPLQHIIACDSILVLGSRYDTLKIAVSRRVVTAASRTPPLSCKHPYRRVRCASDTKIRTRSTSRPLPASTFEIPVTAWFAKCFFCAMRGTARFTGSFHLRLHDHLVFHALRTTIQQI